ncbi:hypothetical protein VNO77_03612 [Canavalia gladiata]|uniref:Uncharacterized protein n=1 Tax=Canavalia gladiata TaxID=3824 RepID=A0AAN9N035_CANGL
MTMAELLLRLLVNIEIVYSFLLLLIFLLFVVRARELATSMDIRHRHESPSLMCSAWYCAVLSCTGRAFSDFVMQGRESKGGGESCHLAKLPNGKLLPSILASNRRECSGSQIVIPGPLEEDPAGSQAVLVAMSTVCVKQSGGEWLRAMSHMTKGLNAYRSLPD